MTPDRFVGCLLGLALGDAMGAPYEGGPLERLVWWCIGRTRAGENRWTDDTQMSLDLAQSLLECGGVRADSLAARFAASYRWSRGYGPATGRLLRAIARGQDFRNANRRSFSQGSFGNGAAMRAPILALFFVNDLTDLPQAISETSAITHAHPWAIEGARLVVESTLLALKMGADKTDARSILGALKSHEEVFATRLQWAGNALDSHEPPTATQVAKSLGNRPVAHKSVVTAIYLSARFANKSFEELQTFVIRCGGDTDTIGAIAGALWGAMRGASELPAASLARLEKRDFIESVARELLSHAQEREK